jgi:Abnormal spindle-like microcephaly-assoc'd, ASPM-SPD-2-Hydin
LPQIKEVSVKLLKNQRVLGLTRLAGIMLVATASIYAQTAGTPLGSVTFSADCGFVAHSGHSVGIGITFDGTNLWYSCYDSKDSDDPNHYDLLKADPKTGTVLAAYDIAGGMGAIAYDATRNVIWAGEGGGVSTNVAKIIKIPLDSSQNATAGTYTVAFPDQQAYTSPPTTQDIVDGLAFDAATDVLYVHYDFATEIAKYDAATGAFLGLFFEAPGIPTGTEVYFSPPVPQCVVSGLAIGGNVLLEDADYCDSVWGVKKTNPQAILFNFSFASSVTSFFDNKALTCDTVTFPGNDAVWVKDAFTPKALAFTVPAGTCGVGGASTAGLSTVSVSPTSLSFGKVTIGTTSAPQSVTVTNNTTSAVAVTGVTINDGFSITDNTCDGSIAANGTCSVSVAFSPTSAGNSRGTLVIVADSTALSVSLRGQGTKK